MQTAGLEALFTFQQNLFSNCNFYKLSYSFVFFLSLSISNLEQEYKGNKMIKNCLSLTLFYLLAKHVCNVPLCSYLDFIENNKILIMLERFFKLIFLFNNISSKFQFVQSV